MTSAQNPSTVSSSMQEEVAGKNNSFKIGASIALVLAAVGTVAVCTLSLNAPVRQACSVDVALHPGLETLQKKKKNTRSHVQAWGAIEEANQKKKKTRSNVQAWGAIEEANQQHANQAYEQEHARCMALIGKEPGINGINDVIARAEAARAEALANPRFSGKVVDPKQYAQDIKEKTARWLEETSRPDYKENRTFLYAAVGASSLVLFVAIVILLAGMTDWSCCSASSDKGESEEKSSRQNNHRSVSQNNHRFGKQTSPGQSSSGTQNRNQNQNQNHHTSFHASF